MLLLLFTIMLPLQPTIRAPEILILPRLPPLSPSLLLLLFPLVPPLFHLQFASSVCGLLGGVFTLGRFAEGGLGAVFSKLSRGGELGR